MDEVYTMLRRVEAILNSRPLTVVSDDAKDSHPLNPALLLTGFHNNKLALVVPPVPKTKDEDPKKRFQYLRKVIAECLKKWTTESLSHLQTRSKNMAEKQNLIKGDLMYITDDNSPPLSWPLGIVHETYTENDSLFRVAKIKTRNGNLRPIVKLRKIPIKTSQTQSGNSEALEDGPAERSQLDPACRPSHEHTFGTCVPGHVKP